jgi:hypothetical protein
MALDPLTAALDIGGKVLERLWPNPADRAAAELELLKLHQSGELAQIAVNLEEAKSPSLFTSGWRPGVGWCCVAACTWNWLGLPMCRLAGEVLGHPIALAPADLTEMLPILMGLLGLGGLRTVEKLNKA